MSSPFRAAEPETINFGPQESSPSPSPNSSPNPSPDPINQKITSIMNFINSWEKNENDVAKIWELLKMYFTFLEDIQHILVPILQKVYSIQNETRLIPLLNQIGKISTSVDLLDILIQLRTNVQLLTPEEVELLKKIRLEFQENRSVLLIIKEIISRLEPDKRNQLEAKFSKAMQPYKSSPNSEPKEPKNTKVSFLENEVTIPVVSKKMKTKWIIAIVVIIVLLLIAGGYCIYAGKGSFGGGAAASAGSGSDGYVSDNNSVRSFQSSIGGSS